jgi:lysine 2,3-aminomutase
MEIESLFSEEMEPPGQLNGLTGLEKAAHDLILPQEPVSSPPPVVPVRPDRHPSCFTDSRRSQVFRKRFYPGVSREDWQDWRWQLKNRISDHESLGLMVWLSEEERSAMTYAAGPRPVAITPYYASLLDAMDVSHSLRRSMIPVMQECFRVDGEKEDPLDEEKDSPVPGLVHRYPDRVLFLVTGTCAAYCRYCTRSRIIGRSGAEGSLRVHWEKAIDYIASHPAIRDVLLSGGDPLTLHDRKIEWLLSRLSRIPHVEMLRIGTKVPVTLPQRITPELVKILKRYHPLWLSLHVTHPDELTAEMRQACMRLADGGIPLGSQTVLLAGVNDSVEVMRRLFRGLLRVRVRPYYLYQCDPIPGSAHFRTPVIRGIEIIEGLRGHTSGYAVPTFVIDAPGGGGKIPLLPEYVVGRDGPDLLIRNYEGKVFRYPDGGPVRHEIH